MLSIAGTLPRFDSKRTITNAHCWGRSPGGGVDDEAVPQMMMGSLLGTREGVL